MASEFQVQYLDSENKLVKTVITSNSSSEVERSIKDLDGDVLSIVEKKSPSFNRNWRAGQIARKNKFHSTAQNDVIFWSFFGTGS